MNVNHLTMCPASSRFLPSGFLHCQLSNSSYPWNVAQCQGMKAGRQQLYSWEKEMLGRVQRAGSCSSMLWFRFIDWKVPSILKLLRCYSVRYRGCIWLRKILEE